MIPSNRTLALSKFNEREIRAITVNNNHPDFYHVYYKKDSGMCVMLVPKKTVPFDQLQSEVETLLERTSEQQIKVGYRDR
jgi:hypothetical protein